MKIIKKGNLCVSTFTCERCNTVFKADIRDWEEREFSICSVPRDRGIPKDIVDAHTTRETEFGVYCPICKQFITLDKGV